MDLIADLILRGMEKTDNRRLLGWLFLFFLVSHLDMRLRVGLLAKVVKLRKGERWFTLPARLSLWLKKHNPHPPLPTPPELPPNGQPSDFDERTPTSPGRRRTP